MLFHTRELFILLGFLVSTCHAGIRYFPLRHPDEAAVIEWGNSAIISALDAVVAGFGPQTSQAALLEVETAIVFAQPLEGITMTNKEEIAGNVVVSTNTAKDVTPVQLATAAQAAGAAALVIVHVDDSRPDEAPRFQPGVGEEDAAASIDIPVVAISMSSAGVLAMATIPEEDRRHIRSLQEANGLPERIRLYAGEDRPFFEDIEAERPTLYLIHNLLTPTECDALFAKAAPKAMPIVESDPFSYTKDPSIYTKTSRAILWQGDLQTATQKTISERISQVTGFPTTHFSDFIVDFLQRGAFWKTQADTNGAVATVHVFLADGDAEWVYAHTHSGNTIRIQPRRGMAIVHHNTNHNYKLDLPYIQYSLESVTTPLAIAHKYIFTTPIPVGRRIVLPLLNGNGMGIVRQVYDALVGSLGEEDGSWAFDTLVLLGLPLCLVGLIVQGVVSYLQQSNDSSKPSSKTKTQEASSKSKKKNGRKKKD